MELYTEDLITTPTFAELQAEQDSSTIFQPRIVGPFSMSKDGVVTLGEHNIVLDAPNHRILIYDTSDNPIVLIGDLTA